MQSLINLFIGSLLVWTMVSLHAGEALPPSKEKAVGKKVFLTILARNKAHLLPKYLQCIENLDYDKKLMTLYVHTNNNSDDTQKILEEWMKKHEKNYQLIIYEKENFKLDDSTPHEWSEQRLKILGELRNKSLRKAKENQADYYFVVDCDNFIAPYTLRDLINKDKPIIAPMLRSIPEPGDVASNFFADVTEDGYYKASPDYFHILERNKVGTFKIPVVHCTYLIKAEYLDKLNYTDDTDEWEFIIFSRSARENGIDQYICNEKQFGTNINFFKKLTLEEERERVKTIPLSDFMLTY
jgi:hypothetical protein